MRGNQLVNDAGDVVVLRGINRSGMEYSDVERQPNGAIVRTVVGGRGTLIGPIIGAIGVNALKSWATRAFPDLWLLILVPVVGYAFAWYAHFFVEGNKPATFGHPFYSLVADYRMLFLMMAGKMDDEVARIISASQSPSSA